MGLDIGGLAAAYQGAMRGIRQETRRQWDEEDRGYFLQQRARLDQQQREDRDDALEQRALRRGQQQRTLDAQQREDTLRDDLSKVVPAGADLPAAPAAGGGDEAFTDVSSLEARNGLDVGMPQAPAVRAKQTQDQALRDVAEAYRRAGDIGRAMDLHQRADQLAFSRSATRFNQVLAGARSLDVGALARQIGEVFEADPSNGGIEAIDDVPGGVRVTIRNRDSGATSTREFTGPAAKQDLIGAFQAYYTPETWSKLVEQQGKLSTELAKNPVVRVDDGFYDKASGRFVRTRAAAPAAPARAATAPSALADVHQRIDDFIKGGETKPVDGNVVAQAHDYAATLMQSSPGLDATRAARIALAAATNPAALKMSIDADTGLINQDFVDADGMAYLLTRGVADAASAETKGVPKDQLREAARRLVAAQGDEASQRRFAQAAFEPAAREALVAEARQAAGAVLRQVLEANRQAASPRPEAELQAQVAQRLEGDLQAIDRKLALVKAYGERPAKLAPSAAVRKLGGLQAAVVGRSAPAGGGGLERTSAFELKNVAQSPRASAAARAAAQAELDRRSGQTAADLDEQRYDPSLYVGTYGR